VSFFVTPGRSPGCPGVEELNGCNVLADILVALTFKPFVSELDYFLLMFSVLQQAPTSFSVKNVWNVGTILA